jgi:hypothetical protein
MSRFTGLTRNDLRGNDRLAKGAPAIDAGCLQGSVAEPLRSGHGTVARRMEEMNGP